MQRKLLPRQQFRGRGSLLLKKDKVIGIRLVYFNMGQNNPSIGGGRVSVAFLLEPITFSQRSKYRHMSHKAGPDKLQHSQYFILQGKGEGGGNPVKRGRGVHEGGGGGRTIISRFLRQAKSLKTYRLSQDGNLQNKGNHTISSGGGKLG